MQHMVDMELARLRRYNLKKKKNQFIFFIHSVCPGDSFLPQLLFFCKNKSSLTPLLSVTSFFVEIE